MRLGNLTALTSGKGEAHDKAAAAIRRQEARSKLELAASGQLWKIAKVLHDETATANTATAARLKRYADSTDPASWHRDIQARKQETQARLDAIGPSGHDVQRRLFDAGFRYATERIALKLYIAAFVDSVRRIPAYAAHYGPALLQRLEDLSEMYALLGSGADRVFECLAWVDLISKQISLNTQREERSFVVHVKEQPAGAVPLYRGTVTIPADGGPGFRLLRYIRLATLNNVTLADVRLQRDAVQAWIGSAIPINCGGGGADVAVEHFWNQDLAGDWLITAGAMAPEDLLNTVGLLLSFGYEAVPTPS